MGTRFISCPEKPKMVGFADHFGRFRAWIPERSDFFKRPKGPKGPLGPERSDFFKGLVADAKTSSKGQSMEPNCDVEKLKFQSSCKGNWSYKSTVSKRSRHNIQNTTSFENH